MPLIDPVEHSQQRYGDGRPDWFDQDGFEFVAKMPPSMQVVGPGSAPVDIAALRKMWQTLLHDRFGMTWHYEDRPANVFAMETAPRMPQASIVVMAMPRLNHPGGREQSAPIRPPGRRPTRAGAATAGPLRSDPGARRSRSRRGSSDRRRPGPRRASNLASRQVSSPRHRSGLDRVYRRRPQSPRVVSATRGTACQLEAAGRP